MKITSPGTAAPPRVSTEAMSPIKPEIETPKTGVEPATTARTNEALPQSFKVPDAAKEVDTTSVQVHYDAMSKTIVSSVVNKETGLVVTEMPPEALRTLAERTAEFRGKIFNIKA